MAICLSFQVGMDGPPFICELWTCGGDAISGGKMARIGTRQAWIDDGFFGEGGSKWHKNQGAKKASTQAMKHLGSASVETPEELGVIYES